MVSTFVYNNPDGKQISRNFDPSKVTPKILGKVFKLDESSISLIADSELYEQLMGNFQELPTTADEFEVLGDVAKLVVAPVLFNKHEIEVLRNEVTNCTLHLQQNLAGLTSAPQAVRVISILTILAACTKDPSLKNERTKNFEFKLLHNPNSFRASLVQLINQITEAFINANAAICKLYSNMVDVPTLLSSSMEAICKPNDHGVPEILNLNKERISLVSENCAKEAKGIAGIFDMVMQVIYELEEVAQATQSYSDDELAKIKKEGEEAKQRQETILLEQQDLEELLQRQKRQVEEAQVDFNKKSANLGSLGMMTVACLCEVALLHGANGRNHIAQVSVQPKHALEKTYERKVLDFLVAFFQEELTTEILAQFPEAIAPLLRVRPVTEQGKNIYHAVEKLLKHLKNVKNPEEAISDEKVKKWHQVLDVAVQAAVEMQTKQDAKKAEQLKIAAGMLSTMADVAADSRKTLSSEREKEDDIQNKVWETRKEICDLTLKIQNVDLDKLDLTDIMKYLGEFLKLLGSVKASWIQMSQFFSSMKNVVEGPMKTNFDDFLKKVDCNTNSQLLKKELLKNAVKACGIIMEVMSSALIYRDISQEFVISQIAVVSKNLQLSKDKAKALLPKCEEDFTKENENVLKFISDRKLKLFNETEQQLEILLPAGIRNR